MFFLCKNSKKKPIFQIFYCFSVNDHGLYAISDNLDQRTGSADPLLDAITSENQFASAPVHLYLWV